MFLNYIILMYTTKTELASADITKKMTFENGLSLFATQSLTHKRLKQNNRKGK